MYDDLTTFERVAELRCAMLEAQPSGLTDEIRSGSSTPSKRYGKTIASSSAISISTPRVLEIAEQSKHAFAAGLFWLPQHAFTGLVTLMTGGIPLPAIVLAEEVSGAYHILTSPMLRVRR